MAHRYHHHHGTRIIITRTICFFFLIQFIAFLPAMQTLPCNVYLSAFHPFVCVVCKAVFTEATHQHPCMCRPRIVYNHMYTCCVMINSREYASSGQVSRYRAAAVQHCFPYKLVDIQVPWVSGEGKTVINPMSRGRRSHYRP